VAEIGNASLLLAFVTTLIAIASLVLAVRRSREAYLESGRRAIWLSFAFVTLAVGTLLVLLARSDFSIEYVASYTNRDLPLFYKLAALWGGQAGSLLLWSWILFGYASFVAWRHRHPRTPLFATALALMAATGLFFLFLDRFVVDPFGRLAVVTGDGTPVPFTPRDGQGLNPLLQHPAMVAHPPTLYLGFVGFVVPFAFAMAALVTRELGNEWIRLTRRWTLTAWLFLSVGILLGAKWAYVELGWGGYWAWDPVENASLMPWLTATAFIHSVIVQERRNMLKVWNVVLVVLTYLLCVFGTFLTRSGIVSSVHAFAQSSIGIYFVLFLALAGAASVLLVLSRLDHLRGENELDSLVSRESAFLLNNMVFLAATFAVFWGTLFPVISEAIQGEKITVGAPFFNRIEVPLGLAILFLTGVGPLLAWRKTSAAGLKRNFLLPSAAAFLAAAGVVWRVGFSTYPLLSLALASFVAVTILEEFARGVRARRRRHGEGIATALVKLFAKNRRRYGGYLVHFGVVLLFVGFTGAAFDREAQARMRPGDETRFAGYRIVCQAIDEEETPNYFASIATLDVYEGGKKLRTIRPEKRFYKASQQPSSEVAILTRLREDLYVVYAGTDEDSRSAIVQMYLKPLVSFVWLGGTVLTLGTLVALWPERRRRRERDTVVRLVEARVRAAVGGASP
jgi:cytochrome c-type biogenesis protein CcmF